MNKTNSSISNEEFKLRGNLIYYSLTKSKYITRSILALEIYSIVVGVNITITIRTILNIVIK